MQPRNVMLAAISTIALGASATTFAKAQNLRQESQDYLDQNVNTLDLAAHAGDDKVDGFCAISGNCGVSIFSGIV